MFKRFVISLTLLVAIATGLESTLEYATLLREEKLLALAEKKADSLVAKMSLEDLSGQLIHVAIPAKTLDKTAKTEIENIRPGGVILFGKNIGSKKEIQKLTKDLQKFAEDNRVPSLIISADQEGGRVIRATEGVTMFPGAMALGQTRNSDYALFTGFQTSLELKNLGINMFFAPVLDINNNPKNPVINTRSIGPNRDIVTRLGTMFEEGARAGGSIPVIKHFPGHGDTSVDSHIGLPVISKTMEELETFELIPFKSAINNGADAVMTAHIIYPKIDPDMPATLSRKILTGYLREKLHYQGVIFTDAMEMEAVAKHFKHVTPAIKALQAGADILLFTSWGKETALAKNQVVAAVRDGILNKKILEDAVKKQFILKLKYDIIHDDELAELHEIRGGKKEKLQKELEKNHRNLNKLVSMQSIRSLGSDIDIKSISPDKALIVSKKNEIVEEAKKAGIPAGSTKDIPKYSTIIFSTISQKEINSSLELAEKFPDKKFILLHYGTPYLDFGKHKNVNVLLSFSPTEQSLRSIIRVLTGKMNIKAADI